MKFKLTTLAVATAIAGAALGFTPASAADDTINKIKSAGALRACFADDNPWAFKNPGTGNWEGVVPDMAAALAESMSVKLVQVDASWSTLLQGLLADQCDVVAASLFANVKRAEQVIFTDPFAVEYMTVYVQKDSPYKTYAEIDAAGKTIAVRAGTAPADFANRFFKNAKVKSYLADTSLTILTDVATKRADGWIDSVISTGRFLTENPQYPLRPIGDAPLEPARVVWALKPGDYQFQQLVNTFFFNYRSAGKMAASWEKWFNAPYEAPR